jgi:hypothetical protein
MGVAEGTGYIIGFDNEAVVKHLFHCLMGHMSYQGTLTSSRIA